MRVIKIVSVLVAVAGTAALGLVVAPSVFGRVDAPVMAQGRPAPGAPFDWAREKAAFAFFDDGSQIGASIRELEPAEADRLKLTGGAVVEDVRPDSPAARARLRRSDVIVMFDSEPVRSVRQFTRLVQETPAGRTVTATIVREGQRSNIQLTPADDRRAGTLIDGDRVRERFGDLVARMPEFDFKIDVDALGTGRGRLGVTVSQLSGQLAAYFGAKEGVLVTAVAEGSPAEKAGLKAGDVITSVNSERVTSPSQLTRALRGVNDAAEVTLGIVRDKKETAIKATIERPQPARSVRPI
jgi:serine protease Do